LPFLSFAQYSLPATTTTDQVDKGPTPGVDGGQAGKRAVRFSYASSEENIREAARRLGEYLRGR
jgi:hypothetical protein